MTRVIDLSFFGGGGTSKETVSTHSEKSDYLKNMDSAMYKFFQPIASKYGGMTLSDVGGTSDSTVGDTLSQYGVNSTSDGTSWLDDPTNTMKQGFDLADQTYLTGMQNANNLIQTSGDYLSKQGTTTDEAAQLIRDASNMSQEYLDEHKDLLANGTNSGLQNYMNEVANSINTNFSNKASSAIANAAARGIVNSSTSNKAISDLEKASAQATAEQYANGFSTYAQNYLNGATTAAETASKNGTNLLAAASAYGDAYKNALSGIESNQNAASKAYTTALSPVMSAYQYWRDLNTDHTNQDTEDTIVTSGGK